MASIRKIEGKGGVSYKITVSMGRDAQEIKTLVEKYPQYAKEVMKYVEEYEKKYQNEER